MVKRRSNITGILLAVLTVALSLLAVAAPAPAASTDLYARMHASSPYPNAHGRATYEGHPGWREFGVHVRGLQTLAGRTLKVTVHGDFVGRLRVSQDGTAHLYRQSGIPRCSGGNIVRLRTKAGTLVAYGSMRHEHRHTH